MIRHTRIESKWKRDQDRRARRRRWKARAASITGYTAVTVAILLLIVVMAGAVDACRKANACDDAGGTWIPPRGASLHGQCVRLERINL